MKPRSSLDACLGQTRHPQWPALLLALRPAGSRLRPFLLWYFARPASSSPRRQTRHLVLWEVPPAYPLLRAIVSVTFAGLRHCSDPHRSFRSTGHTAMWPLLCSVPVLAPFPPVPPRLCSFPEGRVPLPGSGLGPPCSSTRGGGGRSSIHTGPDPSWGQSLSRRPGEPLPSALQL